MSVCVCVCVCVLPQAKGNKMRQEEVVFLKTLIRGCMSGKEKERGETSLLSQQFGYGSTLRVIRKHSQEMAAASAMNDVAHMCMDSSRLLRLDCTNGDPIFSRIFEKFTGTCHTHSTSTDRQAHTHTHTHTQT